MSHNYLLIFRKNSYIFAKSNDIREIMAKDLTTSAIERQNILNNTVALPRIQNSLGIEQFE